MFQHSRQAEGGNLPGLGSQSRLRGGRDAALTVEGKQHSQGPQACQEGWRLEKEQWEKIGKGHEMSLKSSYEIVKSTVSYSVVR